MVIFQYCKPFGSFSPSFWAGGRMVYVRIALNYKSATCSCVPNNFHFVLSQMWAGRSVQSYEKRSLFQQFQPFGSFFPVFRQLKEQLILKVYETIRVAHAITCPMDFNLLCDRSQQLGVLKMLFFLDFYSSLGFFPNIQRRLGLYLC